MEQRAFPRAAKFSRKLAVAEQLAKTVKAVCVKRKFCGTRLSTVLQ